jgi:hypothetical protein
VLDQFSVGLITTATVVAFVVFVWQLRKVIRAGEWSPTATMAFLLMLLAISLVDIIVTYTKQWNIEISPFKDSVISYPNWADKVQLAFYILILLGSAGIFVGRLGRSNSTINIPALLFLLVTLISAASAIGHGDNPFTHQYLLYVAVAAATIVAPRGLGIHIGHATMAVLASVAAGLTVLVNPGFAALQCTGDKCGVLGFVFRGILENENALALYLALAMPLVYIAFEGWAGAALVTYMAFLVALTGGRTGTIAAFVTYALLLIVRPSLRDTRHAPWRAVLLYSVLGLAFVIGLALPFVENDPSALTGRVYLWMTARSAFTGLPALLSGMGSTGWQHVRDAGLIDFSAVYSVHNEWLQVLYSTGLCGSIVVAAALIVLMWQAGKTYRLVLGSTIAPAICLAIAERPWSLDVVDWLLWALPAALLSFPEPESTTSRQPRAGGRPGHERAVIPMSAETGFR